MAKYTWRDSAWRDSEGNPIELTGDGICTPMIQSDLPAYFSVASGKMVDGRRARRDDLARTGCREVDPSEGPKYCATEKWAKKLKMEWNPDAGKPKHRAMDYLGTRTNGS